MSVLIEIRGLGGYADLVANLSEIQGVLAVEATSSDETSGV